MNLVGGRCMVTILIGSYNGEKYIGEQLDSILRQTFQDFVVCICDDCSTDCTFQIIQNYVAKYPEKIRAKKNLKNTGNAKYNFYELMTSNMDDYIMLCDQDDVWLDNKIEITLKKMKEAERKYGVEKPILVHTDLIVVNQKLEVISSSYREAMNSNFYRTKLRDQLIQNTLTGCTAMYNKEVCKRLKTEHTPDYMVMHDWWLNLVVSAFGVIVPMEERTILYRQHENNEIGAKDVCTLRYKICELLNYDKIKVALNQTYPQGMSFLKVYKEMLTVEQNNIIEKYCEIPQMNKIQRWKRLKELGTYKNGFARKVAQFIFV